MSIFRTRIANDYVQFEEQIPIGQRIRYVHQHTDGRIVLWTDDEFVVFVTPAKQDATAQFIEDHVSASGLDAELKTQVQSAIEGCMQCHSFRPDEHQNAPGLGAIAGERFGSTKFAGYSAAMRAASGYWDEENLITFIEQPSQVVPGTVAGPECCRSESEGRDRQAA
ncbi:MAG: hypothetical protein GXP06_11605 [Alphaproteobacteria bacterium]|nr:hypothetical protein [Alphaproteobacteria bacterium]